MDGFISYARKDRALLEELLVPQFKTLARSGVPSFWYDRHITGGEEWSEEIRKAIAAARYFILLLSPDALASDYIMDTEIPAIRLRVAICRGLIIPVLLRSCVWEAFPVIKSLQLIPDGRTRPEAITLWDDKDAATTTTARQLRAAIDHHKVKNPPGIEQ